MSKTLLMIAYHFPPKNAIGAARPFRFYKYAQMFGWTPLVVTATPQKPADASSDVHYIADPFFTKPRSREWHTERVIRRFATPGELGMLWSRHAARFCEARIDAAGTASPVVLYSTFPPVGAHLAALRVLRKRHVCWIADFRDPYASEPTRRSGSTPLSRFVAGQMEKRMIEVPSIVVANSDAAADDWRRQYPRAASKVRVIYNGYDPSEDLLASPLPNDTARKVIIHTGTLYGGRHTGPIMTSVERLIRNGRLSPQSVLFRFVGDCHDGALIPVDTVQSGISQGWIEVIPRNVPRATAIEMAQQAAGLLLVQPQSDTQVPGKLFEYIRFGRPVLAFIRKESAIDHVLSKCGIPNVRIYSEDRGENVDAALLEFLAIPSGPWKPDPWFENAFNAVDQARTLCSFADEALERSA